MSLVNKLASVVQEESMMIDKQIENARAVGELDVPLDLKKFLHDQVFKFYDPEFKRIEIQKKLLASLIEMKPDQ